MLKDWRCIGCGQEIMPEDSIHSFNGKVLHAWCKEKSEDLIIGDKNAKTTKN